MTTRTIELDGEKYHLGFLKYRDSERTALVLNDTFFGDTAIVATVNVPEVSLADGEVLIKTWSENKGVLPALERAGVVEVVDRIPISQWVSAVKCKLLVTE